MSQIQVTQHQPISRKEAAQCGLSRFYTGRSCRAGHIAERYISNRNCVPCNTKYAGERERTRSRNEPSYRLYRNAQRRAGQALKGVSSPVEAIGCCVEELKAHIERQFKKGMTWSNYRQWEVDHINPLSAAKDEQELLRLCHYSNLQPLWRRENRVKGGA